MTEIKVLVVEDEGIVALDIESKLIYSGYNVVGCASSFEEGIDLIKNTRPDVILMDIIIDGTPVTYAGGGGGGGTWAASPGAGGSGAYLKVIVPVTE